MKNFEKTKQNYKNEFQIFTIVILRKISLSTSRGLNSLSLNHDLTEF